MLKKPWSGCGSVNRDNWLLVFADYVRSKHLSSNVGVQVAQPSGSRALYAFLLHTPMGW